MLTTSQTIISPSHSAPAVRPIPVRAVRWSLAGVGVCCVALGAVGAVLPGLPTTIFLIMATWCFTRSCPWLSDKLVHNRFFSPFTKYLVPGAVMPPRAKAIAMSAMWLAIAGSSVLLFWREAPLWVIAAVAASGVVGSWCIVRQGAKTRRSISR